MELPRRLTPAEVAAKVRAASDAADDLPPGDAEAERLQRRIYKLSDDFHAWARKPATKANKTVRRKRGGKGGL
jgi:hypothetical protein